jgi:molybdenum cofactor cytidylyltransferase
VVAARRGAPLSVSLRAGIAALAPIERDAFIFLGDMPGVDPRIAAMLARRLAPQMVAARPRHRGVPGHPVLIRNVRTAVAPRGDAGFRLPTGRVAWIEGRRRCVLDVDSAGDLARLRRLRLAR